jgi:hypothetical protein
LQSLQLVQRWASLAVLHFVLGVRMQFGRSACGFTPACGSEVGMFDAG